ncbi:MAG: molecular chaperone HtpG [Planctomycetota bacterium]|nr:MAG: molecular chaperone HtpG [Planctomycetota bacterium]
MTATTETRSFQAETKQLLDLMIHSLYSHKEIFLRELISNASDAIDKLRIEGLTDDALREATGEPCIRLELDREANTLTIDDNGIGMTREELVENIGTIARSGTREFAQQMQAAKAADGDARAELIGQFGVGFYSSFMVADEVELETLRAGGDEAVRWRSKGDGEYTLEDGERSTPGTRVTLHLRTAESDDESAGDAAGASEFKDFTDEWTVRQVVKRYSDFVEHPIQMDVERSEKPEGDDDAELVSVTKTETLNSRRPLWTRSPKEVKSEEHAEFYRHVSNAWSEPLHTLHFKAEGTHEWTALLYLPTQRGMDAMDPSAKRSRVALHVKRVFVMADCEELVPAWLRFVHGVVDSADLPLNVSRETLQHARQMGQIRKRITKKLIDAFRELLEGRRDDYVAFWGQFGTVIKEGLFGDGDHRDELARVALFDSTHDDALTTLGEYLERMPLSQKEILYVTGTDRRAAVASPHIEAARKAGHEVLLLTDPVDEWVMSRFTEFEGKRFKALDKGDVEVQESDDAKTQREDQQKQLGGLFQAIEGVLDEHVSEVRLSGRLSESPAVLVGAEGGMSQQMEEVLRASGQAVPKSKRVLELNPKHAVLTQLERLFEQTGGGGRFDDFVELVFGQALLAEGSAPADPARFAKLLAGLLAPEASSTPAPETAPEPETESESDAS